MQPQASDSLAAWPAEIVAPHGILVLSGYGLDVRVWRGRLRVADGIGRDRREALVHRATGRLRRLVVLGHTGAISLEAVRWLVDVGAAYLQIDADGRVLAAFGPRGTDRPSLRRAQALALDAPVGVDIARRLIAAKVAAQASALAAGRELLAVTDETVATMRDAAARLHVAASRDDVRLAEAQAAAAYWSAWATVPVRFARRDADRVPAHWRTVGSRSSPLTGGPRLAANPANALLNYLYALLEGEASVAARIVGLDPGMGVLHADQPNRDSLACDLMEPIRPVIESDVLRLLAARPFAAADFYETREGACRITPPLARQLAEESGDLVRGAGQVAEDVARLLEARPAWQRPLPTHLSGRNRSAGRATSAPTAPRAVAAVPPARACLWCGAPLRGQRKTCRGACERAVQAENTARFAEVGARVLQEHRRSGASDQWTEASRERLGEVETARIREARAWQREGRWPTDMGAFKREILPTLADVSAGALARSTGLSVGYCRRIKKGLVVPHPMWWERLVARNETSRGDTDGAPATIHDR